MLHAFYQTKPVQDTPYRQLSLMHQEDDNKWHVRMTGGTKWGIPGREDRTILEDIPVESFDAGKPVYDRLFSELEEKGWRPYTPYETWE
jgi:hypothetical protein